MNSIDAMKQALHAQDCLIRAIAYSGGDAGDYMAAACKGLTQSSSTLREALAREEAQTAEAVAFNPAVEGRLSLWLTNGADLHPLTINLVVRFARALSAKLAAAEVKYGYSDGWRNPDWMDECRDKLLEHIAKGDPRDVAAYCAFLWHHGESTAVRPAPTGERAALIKWVRAMQEMCRFSDETSFLKLGKAADMLAADEKQSGVLLDRLQDILDAKVVMREHGIPQADFPTMFKAFAQQVAKLQALSVTNILLDVVPGDGSGLEVYAKSVKDVEGTLTKMGAKIEDLQGAQQVAVPQEPKTPQYFTEVDFANLEVRVFMRQPDALPIQVFSEAFAAPQPPQEREPMTEHEINDMWEDAHRLANPTVGDGRFKFARAIEAHHGIGKQERKQMTDMQRQLNEAQVAEFGSQSAARHLGSLVDFERQVSDRAMQIMKALMDAAQPINTANQDCEIPASAYREFVDANAELLFVKKNGHRPEPTSIKQEPADWAAS